MPVLQPHQQPLAADIAPLEVEVRTSWRRSTTLRVSGSDIRVDGKRIALGEITGVAYAASTRAVNVTQRGVARVVRLELGDTVAQVDLGCPVRSTDDETARHAYRAILEVLHHRVEPRLRAQLAAGVLAGQVVPIGGFALHRGGLLLVRRLRPPLCVGWDEVPCALVDGDQVAVRRAGEATPFARQSCLHPNGVLLPELLEVLLAELH